MSKKNQIVAAIISAVVICIIAIIVAGRANASTLGMKWSHQTHRWPYLVVENDARDTNFPVWKAVHTWGKPLHYGRCNHHPSAPCIRVYAQRMDPHYTGNTAFGAVPGHPHQMGIAIVYMNTYYKNYNYHYRLEAVAHELGHAMGLDHDYSGGVMQPGIDGHHAKVSRFEHRELRRLYHI